MIRTMKLMFLVATLSVVTAVAWGADVKKPVVPQIHPVVVMKTSMGSVRIELFADKAPATVKNFLQYVDEKFYDGTIFHRVIPTFMIQGGGFDASLKQKSTHPPIINEGTNGLKNVAGTVAMARTSIPDSATAQFFINVKDNPALDYRDDTPRGAGYAVFGKVVDGMDVVLKIKDVPTGFKNGMGDVPVKVVTIESIRKVGGK